MAKWRKNPAQSKKMEINVIERNSTRILSGLMLLCAVSPANTSRGEIVPQSIRTAAPRNGTTQKIFTLCPLTRTEGFTSTTATSAAQVIGETAATRSIPIASRAKNAHERYYSTVRGRVQWGYVSNDMRL